MPKTLDPQPNLNVKSEPDSPVVKAAIKLISDSNPTKTKRDQKNEVIKRLFENGFVVNSADGLRKVHSKMLTQAVLKVISRMKPLDAQFHASGAPQFMENIVTDAVRTIADKGGFDSALRDKGGAFWDVLLYSDAHTLMMGNPDEDSSIPFVFDNIDNAKVYVNTNATKMRGGRGKSVTRMLIVMPFKWCEFKEEFPEGAKIAGAGRLPSNLDDWASTEYSEYNQIRDEDIVEVGYLFDISSKSFVTMAGSAMTIIDEFYDEDYPFVKDNDCYIPVMQHMCIPSAEDYYNHGIGDYIYELAVLSQQLLNMGSAGVLNETLPIDVLNIPKQKASSFFNQMLSAQEERMQGKRPYVAIEYDPNNPGASQVQSQTLQTQYTNRWADLIKLLEGELQKIGINLYESEYSPNASATEIISVEQAQLSFVKQMQEFNASEYQFFYEVMLDMIKDFIDPSDETPVNITTKPQTEDGRILELEGITLGMVADELNKRDYFVKVNSRSGAIPSGIMQQQQIVQVLQSTPPGTPAYFRLLRDFSSLNDRDFTLEDFGYNPEPEQAEQPPQAEQTPQGVLPSQTDRERINPRSPIREAAL
jgi:hypothetical protein